MFRALSFFLVCTALCACTEQSQHTPQSKDDRLFDTQRDALEKARQMEKQVNEAAKKQRQMIDAQEGGGL